MRHVIGVVGVLLSLLGSGVTAEEFYNQRVIFATPWNATQPYVRWGEQFIGSTDQVYVGGACLRQVWPYGNTIANGAILEFPGDYRVPGALAHRCFFQVTEGSCATVSGTVLPEPDYWGARYRVTSMSAC